MTAERKPEQRCIQTVNVFGFPLLGPCDPDNEHRAPRATCTTVPSECEHHEPLYAPLPTESETEREDIRDSRIENEIEYIGLTGDEAEWYRDKPHQVARHLRQERDRLARELMQTLAAIQIVAEGRESQHIPDSVAYRAVVALRSAYDEVKRGA